MKDSTKEKLDKIKKERRSFNQEFQEFINRGSVMDLAVGIIIGGAFTSIVNSLVNDVVMPIVGLIAGGVDFTNLAIDIPNFFGTGDHAHIAYGNFIQNVVQFFIIAFAVFLMIRTVNNARRKSDENRAKLAAKAEELKAKAAAYKEEKAAKKKK